MDSQYRSAYDVLEQVADVFYVLRLEPDTGFEYVSPAVERMVGYTPEQHYTDPNLGMKLIDPRDIPVLAGTFTAEIGSSFTFMVRWIAKDGRTIWTEHTCKKVRRSDDSVVVYGAARDVTRQHEVEESLREAQTRSRLILDNISDVLLQYDRSGLLMWASPSLERVFGWDPEKVIGTPFMLYPAQDRERVAEMFGTALRDGLVELNYRFRARRADGTLVWAEARGHAIWNSEPEPMILEAVRDISAVVEAEETILAVAENASDVVLRLDRAGRVVWSSPTITQTLGWQVADVVGKPVAGMVVVADLHRAMGALVGQGAAAQTTFEARFRCRDAGFKWMSVMVRSVLAADGRVVARVCSGRDISAERATEEHLRSAAAAVAEAVLLPPPRTLSGMPVAVRYQSAALESKMGGDLYAILETEWGWRIVIGDVMGKGLGAVQLAAAVIGSFRESADRDPDLRTVAARLERTVTRTAAYGDFVTALILQVVPDPLHVSAINLGHPNPLIIRGGRSFEAPVLATRPLGLGVSPQIVELEVTTGDVIFCHTDGLSEARDSSRRFFDVGRALDTIEWADLSDGLDAMLSRVTTHVGGGLGDDVALVCLRLGLPPAI